MCNHSGGLSIQHKTSQLKSHATLNEIPQNALTLHRNDFPQSGLRHTIRPHRLRLRLRLRVELDCAILRNMSTNTDRQERVGMSRPAQCSTNSTALRYHSRKSPWYSIILIILHNSNSRLCRLGGLNWHGDLNLGASESVTKLGKWSNHLPMLSGSQLRRSLHKLPLHDAGQKHEKDIKRPEAASSILFVFSRIFAEGCRASDSLI